MLQHLYEDIFRTTVITTTEHTINISPLSFLVSRAAGITLSGAVTVNGYSIALSTTGSVEAVAIPASFVTVESASLDLTIGSNNFMVMLAGCITVHELNFEVTDYMNKTGGRDLEYTLYGACIGDLYLRNFVFGRKGYSWA